jgi:hypothetical protein
MIATMTALILGLVLAASQAEATCAWVLWEHSLTVLASSKLGRLDGWKSQEASESKSSCEDALGKTIRTAQKIMKQGMPSVVLTPKGYMMMLTQADGTQSMTTFEYLCLPDTVDPREKGATR